MQFQRVNRTDAEVVFGVCKNVSGGTLSGNYPVSFCTTSGSADGVGVVAPAAANLVSFCGFVNADIGDTNYGLYQCYGYRASVRVYAHGTSVTTATGSAIGPNAGSNGVSSTGLITAYGPVVAMEAIGAAVNSPGGYAKGWIRLL